MTTEDLIRFWAKLGDATVHLDDAPILGTNSPFETRLIPLPWNGPIRKSRVFVAMLNPSLHPKDLRYEAGNRDFTRHLQRNQHGDASYVYLDQRFQDHPGAAWARQTFGSDNAIIRAANVCVLQLIPYHCVDGGMAGKFSTNLRSADAMRAWVQSTLLSRMRLGDAVLVIARATRAYGVEGEPDTKTFIQYAGSECRLGYVTKNVGGGIAIRTFISGLNIAQGSMQ